ncbi:hypothetical protein MASSI9I_20454 [Massilia sp. 9I]|nr:hypothetical protein MASSI9I_20454 [Massilia sp. 9I]
MPRNCIAKLGAHVMHGYMPGFTLANPAAKAVPMVSFRLTPCDALKAMARGDRRRS